MGNRSINLEEVARRLAPRIRFHPNEHFFPSSVEWFLNRCSVVSGGATIDYADNNLNFQLPAGMTVAVPGPLTVERLYAASNSTAFGGDEIDHKSLFPLAAAPGTSPSYSRRGYFTNYQLDTLAGQRVNGVIEAPCYVRITTDIKSDDPRIPADYDLISYYFFCPYNGAMGGLTNSGKPMAPFTRAGGYYAHLGDWMRLSARVRVNDGQVTVDAVEFEAHGDTMQVSAQGGNTIDPWAQLLAYSAWHSHELFPSARPDWPLASTTLAVDATADGGTEWDTSRNLIILDEDPRDPAQKWIFYNGLWGANINIYQTITPEIDVDDPFFGIHIKTIPATTLDMQKNGPSGPAFKPDWKRGTQYRPPALGAREFDPAFFVGIYPDLKNAFGTDRAAARSHWATMGLAREGRRGSPGLDVSFYLKLHPDLKAAFGTNYSAALDHWSVMGLQPEGRRATFEFDPSFYLAAYSDLRAAFGNNHGAALDHWLTYGMKEGRRTSREFDLGFYLGNYPDLKAAFGTNYRAVLEHWLVYGMKEGRRTAREFDVGFYLGNYPDLKAAYGTGHAAAINHWLTYGLKEGRRTSREVDVGFYLGNYPDLKAAFGTDYAAALNHWLTYGLKEGRRASRDFDVSFYLNKYPDLKAAFGTDYAAAFNHWLTLGFPKEHREGAAPG